MTMYWKSRHEPAMSISYMILWFERVSLIDSVNLPQIYFVIATHNITIDRARKYVHSFKNYISHRAVLCHPVEIHLKTLSTSMTIIIMNRASVFSS